MWEANVVKLVEPREGAASRRTSLSDPSSVDRAAHSTPWRWADPLILGIIATLVVSIGSWIPSKWNDEGATLSAATRSLPQLWQMMHNVDAVHGTYYFLMHFWVLAFGTSNFALRAPSMIAVGAACAGVVVLGRQLGDRRLSVFAGIAFIVLPRVTWMGIEARATAMTAVVAVWLTIVLLRAIQRRTARWWVLYSVIAGVAVLLNIYLVLLILAHGVSIFIARRRLASPRRHLIGWGLGSLGAGIISLPVDRLTVVQTGQLPFGPLTLSGTLNTLLLEQYFSGATPTVSRVAPVPPTSLWSLGIILAATLGWLLILAPIVRRRFRPPGSEQLPLGFLGLLVPWFVVPTALVIAYSIAVHPMYTGRYFAFTTPAIALLMGASVAALRLPWMRIATFALLALLVLPVYISQRGPTAKNGTDWQQAAAILQARAKPGQDIYYGPAAPAAAAARSSATAVVPASKHKISETYPAVLSSLHDITLKQTPIQAANLWGTSWPLSHAKSVLDSTPLLWAVIEHPGYASQPTTASERYIEKQGLHLVHIWRGSETDILEFTR